MFRGINPGALAVGVGLCVLALSILVSSIVLRRRSNTGTYHLPDATVERLVESLQQLIARQQPSQGMSPWNLLDDLYRYDAVAAAVFEQMLSEALNATQELQSDEISQLRYRVSAYQRLATIWADQLRRREDEQRAAANILADPNGPGWASYAAHHDGPPPSGDDTQVFGRIPDTPPHLHVVPDHTLI